MTIAACQRGPTLPMTNTTPEPVSGDQTAALVRRHLLFGWWSLLVFLTLGIALETLHGFKIGWYLDTTNTTRRLLWTLAHAHGVLLGLVNIAFACTLRLQPAAGRAWPRVASAFLLAATLTLPAGFFLGGFFIYGGDPGLGVMLVPIGAALLFVGVLLTAWGASAGRDSGESS
jgi:hypothetical protein